MNRDVELIGFGFRRLVTGHCPLDGWQKNLPLRP